MGGYGREITEIIVECWGKGLTAHETVIFIEQKHQVKVGVATVYRHRHSLTAKDIIDELMREQRRDIALAQSISVKLKYRDKLLAKLIPQQMTIKTEQQITSTEVKVNIDQFTPEQRKRLLEAEELLAHAEKTIRT